MKALRNPSAALFIPPRIFVVERHSKPARERFRESAVARTGIRPAKELDEVGAAELDLPVGEVVRLLRQVNEPEDDLIVLRRRESELVRPGNGEFSNYDLLPLLVVNLVLEFEGLLTVGNSFRE